MSTLFLAARSPKERTVPHTPHDELSRTLLAEAKTALADGELLEAGDKGWEAASHKVHALAAAWGWMPEDPAEPWATYDLLRMLKRESSEPDLNMLFAAAGHLRTGSFDGTGAEEVVQDCLDDVAEFVAALDRMLAVGGPALPHAVRDEPDQPYSP
ncbi:MAG: hypothetical protein OXN15_10125 [Chloroflexota bacterium]|nr:hypothetical protein [Chloroflexota bacterium]MDE2969755.1 hypothetical protein [Chloroflexota bacterium]